MSRHLTHRFWICFLLGWSGLAFSLLSKSPEPIALTAPFLGVLAFSIADGWWPNASAEAAAVNSPRVVEGDTIEFGIDVVTDQPTWVELEIQFPAMLNPQTATRMVAVVRGRKRFDVSVLAERWGAAGPEWAILTTRDRLGVTERVARYPLHLPVRVHPPAERLTSLVPLYRERPVTGEHRSRRKGPGSELAEVRPYRYGDPMRMVHPRLTARRGMPMVIERHPDRSSDIVLMIDSAQDLGVDLNTTLRWTVTAAMALSERHLRAQDRVGLVDVGHGVRWLPARLGRRHLHTLVDALLATEVLPRHQGTTPNSLAYAPPSQLPKSATIVAISPLLSESTLSTLVDLRSRGHEILVVKPTIPEPEPHIGSLSRRIFRAGNELNERWLRERGAIVIPWSTGDSLEHVMRRVVRNLGRTRQSV